MVGAHLHVREVEPPTSGQSEASWGEIPVGPNVGSKARRPPGHRYPHAVRRGSRGPGLQILEVPEHEVPAGCLSDPLVTTEARRELGRSRWEGCERADVPPCGTVIRGFSRVPIEGFEDGVSLRPEARLRNRRDVAGRARRSAYAADRHISLHEKCAGRLRRVASLR